MLTNHTSFWQCIKTVGPCNFNWVLVTLKWSLLLFLHWQWNTFLTKFFWTKTSLFLNPAPIKYTSSFVLKAFKVNYNYWRSCLSSVLGIAYQGISSLPLLKCCSQNGKIWFVHFPDTPSEHLAWKEVNCP